MNKTPSKSSFKTSGESLHRQDSATKIYCSILARPLNVSLDAESLTEIVSKKLNPVILGGNTNSQCWNGFSTWTWQPIDILVCDNQLSPFGKINDAMNKYMVHGKGSDYPKGMFTGGWIGYFSYDLGRYIESVPEYSEDDMGMPLVYQCFYDKAICYDHVNDKWWMLALEIEGADTTAEAKFDEIAQVIEESHNSGKPKVFIHHIDMAKEDHTCNMTSDEYFKCLDVIKKYIYEGDVYQINFSQRFECDYPGNPVDLFHWQNQFNPSPYSAFLSCDQYSIVSTSPEMFISVCDGIISTKPIKGTRPRYTGGMNHEKVNKVNYRQLVESSKEQAELNMIIDLERNDLAKICIPGSREVIQPRTIEEYPTVFHAVATVAGRLKNPQSRTLVSDILKAVFPGGSITGAPKIRSMEIIEQLEPTRRGLYTGSIGFTGIDGVICWNISIRTILLKDNKAFVQSGGGIVADSDPESEWKETLIKAKALLEGIQSINRAHIKS